MTDKKQNILSAALKLFAKNGVDGTSTSKVARKACVSEGLIFRHFKNKNGLLDAILEDGAEKANSLFQHTLQISDPKEALKAMISAPFKIEKKDHDFWKLMYSLKWQAEVYDNSMAKPIKEHLVGIFEQLGYDKPQAEAEFVLLTWDGVAASILLKNAEGMDEVLEVILAKYNLS